MAKIKAKSIKKDKPVKRVPRKRLPKGQFYCHECGEPGAVKIRCGYCKENGGSGGKVEHVLCNNCASKGCPVAYPREKEAVDILKRLIT